MHEIIKSNIKYPAALAIMFQGTQPETVIWEHYIYQYNGKHYELVSDQDMGNKIYSWFKEHNCVTEWRAAKSDEMIKAIKLGCNRRIKDFDSTDTLINFNNGIFNIETAALIPHSPDYYFSYVIDVDYEPENRKASTFLSFLNSLFCDEKGASDKETMFAIIQIGGYTLYPKNKLEKIFMFLGGGANGKSVLLEVFKMFYNKEFLSSLSLASLSEEKNFDRVALLTSRINISTEQKGGEINAEELKKIASGEEIPISVKNQAVVKNFKSNCKLILASNDIIYFNDNSYAIFRRLYMVNFPNRFVPADEYAEYDDPQSQRVYLIEEKEKLLEKLRAEKSAILNLFLAGLAELRKNGWRLEETTNTKLVKREHLESGDSLGFWLMANYRKIDENDQIDLIAERASLSDVFDEFYNWYCDNIPGKKFTYSKHYVSRKVMEKFRVKSMRDTVRNREGKYVQTYTYGITKRSEVVERDLQNSAGGREIIPAQLFGGKDD